MKFPLLAFVLASVLTKTDGLRKSLRSERSALKETAKSEIDIEPSVTRTLQADYSTKSLGTRSLYFVRVSARDSTPHAFSLGDWIDTHFRTDGTSFKTVVEGCSFWKLKVINVGGMDVMLDGSVNDYNVPSDFFEAARAKVETAINAPPESLADHIVYCQPLNATFWTAIGPQDSNRINMHGSTCMALSVLTHEFGHNLNLLHSGQGDNKYGDVTGMMGASFGASDGPKKCFNGYKHYQLRWFEDRQLDLYNVSQPRIIKLAAFADYHKTTQSQVVIVNLFDTFYLQYNRAKGINEETSDMKDLVTVTENAPGYSLLRQGLAAGDSFAWVQGETTLYVSACRRTDAEALSQPDVMELAVGYGQNWCDQLL